jgi:hypothetical protein
VKYPDYTRICPPIPTRPAGEARTLEQKGALCNDAVVLMDTCLTQCKFCFWQASQPGEKKPIKHSTLAALPLFLKFFFGVFCFCFLLLDLTSQGTDRVTQFVTLMWVWFPLFSSGFGLLKIWFWGARESFEGTMGWTFGVSQDGRKLGVRIVKLKENNNKLELFCPLFCLWFVNFVLIVKQICVPLLCANKNDLLILLCIKSV